MTQATGTNNISNDNTDQNADFILAETLLTGQDVFTEVRTAQYFYNLYKNTPWQSASAYRFCYALESVMDGELEGFPMKAAEKGKAAYPDRRVDPKNAVSKEEWDNLGVRLAALAEMPDDVMPQRAYNNLMKLADYLDLDERSRLALEFIYFAETGHMLEGFLDNYTRHKRESRGVALSRMFDRPAEFKQFGKVLDFSGPLTQFGIVNDFPHENEILPSIDSDIFEAASEEDMNVEQLVARLLGQPVKSDLELSDFEHLGDDLELVTGIVKRAVESGESGINILFYGPPGGGKTELAKAVAQELGLKLYAVGEEEESGDPDVKTSQRRLGHLRQAQALLKGNKGATLLFDEIEDALLKGSDSSKAADVDNKEAFNRLLLTNPVVTFWTGNDVEKFHVAVRDRFSYAIYIDYPPTMVRQKIWQKQCALQGLSLNEENLLDLARQYEAPPRMIAKAVRSAKLTDGGIDVIRKSLEASAKLTYGSREAVHATSRVPEKFSPAIVNTGTDTEQTVNALVERWKQRQPFSLLMEGAKGSGTGSLLRFMSEKMGMNVMEVTMKDLSQPTQFATPEMRVANAFAQAKDGRQFLVVHDITALEANPAASEWSGSLAQTFKACAQRHDMPFAVTHAVEGKLPDSMHFIFTDRLKLKPLDEGQLRTAYEKFFQRPAPDELSRHKGLVLGDFAEVARVVARYGASGLEDGKILDYLSHRLKNRADAGRSAIGFHANL